MSHPEHEPSDNHPETAGGMSSGEKPDPEAYRSADEVLPPVRAPSAGFLFQLFLIPLVIVGIIVLVWVMFSWVAHMGSDPRDLVRDLRRVNASSWQKAYTLSTMLRNPEHDAIKDDSELVRELAQLLESEIEGGQMDQSRIFLRVYVARAIGEFRVTDGLPALLRAVRTEREPEETDVRLAALEAIAVLASNAGPQAVRDHPESVPALIEASREQTNDPARRAAIGELRATAAFTLGVLGGSASLERLNAMLHDPHPNARYNAATGLARHGDVRAKPVLHEMLDPDNPQVVAGERSDGERERKRSIVMSGALAAVEQLGERNPQADLSSLEESIRQVMHSELPRPIRFQARDTLVHLENREGAG